MKTLTGHLFPYAPETSEEWRSLCSHLASQSMIHAVRRAAVVSNVAFTSSQNEFIEAILNATMRTTAEGIARLVDDGHDISSAKNLKKPQQNH